jgi:hypothetical protein
MKQTTVEWLINQLKDMGYDLRLIPNTIELAKTMEKQQKVETWSEAIDYSIMVLKDKTSKTSKEAFDEHYELTYGGNK